MIRLLEKEHTGLLVIDVQEKLMPVMGRGKRAVDNIIRLLHLSELFNLPAVLTEQYPKWLGATLSEILAERHGLEPLTKMHFNCCEVDAFNDRLESEGLKNLILTGVESHICIFQTCVSLLGKGYEVHVPSDAVDSRTEANWRVGLDLMSKAGALITSTETIIYQIMKKAGTREFKKMLKIMK